MTIEEKLILLGGNFRGLWRSITITRDKYNLLEFEHGWAVTYIYQGEIVETPYTDSPDKALDYALNMIKDGK